MNVLQHVRDVLRACVDPRPPEGERFTRAQSGCAWLRQAPVRLLALPPGQPCAAVAQAHAGTRNSSSRFTTFF